MSATDFTCPECGADLAPTGETGVGLCLDHGVVELDDASPDTSSPFDVQLRDDSLAPDETAYRVVVPLDDGHSITLSPAKAENFAEAIQATVSRARDDRDPDGGVVR